MATETQKRHRNSAVIRQNNLCFYCRLPMWNGEEEALVDFRQAFGFSSRQAKMLRCTAEHLKPAQDGGRDTQLNIVAACEICNRRRHPRHAALSWEAYRAFVRERVALRRWHPVSFFKVIGNSSAPAAPKPATSPPATWR